MVNLIMEEIRTKRNVDYPGLQEILPRYTQNTKMFSGVTGLALALQFDVQVKPNAVMPILSHTSRSVSTCTLLQAPFIALFASKSPTFAAFAPSHL